MNSGSQTSKWVCGLLGFCLLLLQACLPQAPPSQPQLSAKEVWQRFQTDANATTSPEGFWLKASLNYAGNQGNHRIVFTMWGNYSRPVRMDLQAGIGTTFSLWRESETGWIAYYPGQEKAYTHENGRRGAQALGLATPFDLQELSRVMTGRLTEIAPNSYRSATRTSQGTFHFTSPSGASIQTLEIAANGRVLAVTGTTPQPWTLTFSDFPSTKSAFAHKITLEAGDAHKAVLRLKEVRWKESGWDQSALQLKLPPETLRLRLHSPS